MNCIQISNFHKKFGQFTAVQDLSFEVKKGELFGFLGRNGAGKTTTIRSLLNIYAPDKGELLINGRPFSDDIRRSIGYLPEERGLYLRASIMDTLFYFGKLRGLNKTTIQQRATELLDYMELSEHKAKKIQNLSSGMQQKIQIMITILHQPEILILDEPFRGLDPINRQLVYDTLIKLRQDGTTILFSSHQIMEVEDFCDRVIIISDGEKKAYGTVAGIKSDHPPSHIRLRYQGKLPKIEGISVLKDTGHNAELHCTDHTDTQQILQKLLEQNLHIELFEVCRPSLNEIFILLCRGQT